MIRRWLALTYYLYALRLAALSHFYFNRLYKLYLSQGRHLLPTRSASQSSRAGFCVRRLFIRISRSRETSIRAAAPVCADIAPRLRIGRRLRLFG
nr:hypothetical protein [uncultured Kingella sp.]